MVHCVFYCILSDVLLEVKINEQKIFFPAIASSSLPPEKLRSLTQ